MGAEMTSRGFTQPGPLNHGEVQAAASATSAAFHLVSAVDRRPRSFSASRVAAGAFDLPPKGPLSGGRGRLGWRCVGLAAPLMTPDRRCAHV